MKRGRGILYFFEVQYQQTLNLRQTLWALRRLRALGRSSYALGARAECSRQGRVFAPGDARVVRLHPAMSEHTTFSPLRQSTDPMSGATTAERSSTQRCQSRVFLSGAPRAECTRRALAEQCDCIRRWQSSVLASGTGRAEYIFPALPEQCASIRRSHSSVIASGAGRTVCLRPALPTQSARVWRSQSRVLASGDRQSRILVSRAARQEYSPE
ncbi:hypothetical protein DFP73DRAFT_598198 [Morchella snyderi]|nr:hypothetical protein DFP73DRAFT_598198 [Morchella snyderi]